MAKITANQLADELFNGSVIEDSTFISDLQNNTNWDASGEYLGVVPVDTKEGDYYYGISSDGEYWMYQYSGMQMYRLPSRIFNAFAEPAPDVSGVTWNDITEDFSVGTLSGVTQGALWQDKVNGYIYMSFEDGEVTRFCGLSATKIVTAINTNLGNTDWQTPGGTGNGVGQLITDSSFRAALQNDANWDNDITYNGSIATGTSEGDYFISQSSGGDYYMYVYSVSSGSPLVYRIQFYVPNAFITAPDVSGVTWTTNGVYSTGTFALAKQGDIFEDNTNGYLYICFTDGTLTRIGGGAGTSETGATIAAKLDSHLATSEWKSDDSKLITDATFITSIITEGNWTNNTYTGGAIPAAVGEGDYYEDNSTSGDTYFYKNVGGVMKRILIDQDNAFISPAPDVSGVTFSQISGTMASGTMVGIKQGSIWKDQTNGYMYISFADDEITRFAYITGASFPTNIVQKTNTTTVDLNSTNTDTVYRYTGTGACQFNVDSSPIESKWLVYNANTVDSSYVLLVPGSGVTFNFSSNIRIGPGEQAVIVMFSSTEATITIEEIGLNSEIDFAIDYDGSGNEWVVVNDTLNSPNLPAGSTLTVGSGNDAKGDYLDINVDLGTSNFKIKSFSIDSHNLDGSFNLSPELSKVGNNLNTKVYINTNQEDIIKEYLEFDGTNWISNADGGTSSLTVGANSASSVVVTHTVSANAEYPTFIKNTKNREISLSGLTTSGMTIDYSLGDGTAPTTASGERIYVQRVLQGSQRPIVLNPTNLPNWDADSKFYLSFKITRPIY